MTSVSELAHILYLSLPVWFIAEELTGGSVDVYIKFGIIPVINKQYSLCDIVEMVDMKCPLKPFQGSNSTTQDLPSLGVSKWLYMLK